MTDGSKPAKAPHIIVLGNEKGGVGKTTLSVHLTIDLLYQGYKVSSIDLDARQRSISRYLENRKKYILDNGIRLPFPHHYIINKSVLDSAKHAQEDETRRFLHCLEKAGQDSDFILMDCPGNDTFLSRLAHSYADTIITPINDSFFDMDVLAKVDPDTHDIDRHGVYSEVVWEAKLSRAQRTKNEITWIVLRNRLSSIDAKNKQRMAEALNKLKKRAGCRILPGLSERVIYRELFLKGLTLLDLFARVKDENVKLSHVTARRELRELLDALQLYPKGRTPADLARAKKTAIGESVKEKEAADAAELSVEESQTDGAAEQAPVMPAVRLPERRKREIAEEAA
jgi:chromosome partitioning protein